jgi:hypothetical protein
LWGWGGIITGGAEFGGGVYGTGWNGSLGGGHFWGGNDGSNDTLFASGGGYFGGPTYGGGYPNVDANGNSNSTPPNSNTFGYGAYGGVGMGGFVTNAGGGSDLSGPFNNINVNTPIGSVQFGWHGPFLGKGSTWILSITKGPSAGWGVSSYPTNTVILVTTRHPCE